MPTRKIGPSLCCISTAISSLPVKAQSFGAVSSRLINSFHGTVDVGLILQNFVQGRRLGSRRVSRPSTPARTVLTELEPCDLNIRKKRDLCGRKERVAI